MDLTAVVTTYRNPHALERCLVALAHDVRRSGASVELIVADDGDVDHQSRPIAERAAIAGAFARVRRVWQTHRGYGKCRLANKAAVEADAALLFYLDGDCLVTPGTVAAHLRLAHPRRYVAGSVLRLNRRASDELTIDAAARGKHADLRWILRQTLGGRIEPRSVDAWLRPLRWLVGTVKHRAGFSGGCSSLPRSLLAEINGWDESFRYGFDDTDLGQRLQNAGAEAVGAPLDAMVVHLWHERLHIDPVLYEEQRRRLSATRAEALTHARQGLAEMGEHDPGVWEVMRHPSGSG